MAVSFSLFFCSFSLKSYSTVKHRHAVVSIVYSISYWFTQKIRYLFSEHRSEIVLLIFSLDKMKCFSEIFLHLILLINKSEQTDENTLLISDPTNIYHTHYTILISDTRVKRQKSPRFYPEINREPVTHGQCDRHTYTKLYNCSYLTNCT